MVVTISLGGLVADQMRYNLVSEVGNRSQGRPEGSLFNSYYTKVYGEGATSFPALLHFTLDTYLLLLIVKQGGIKYHFYVFGMTWPGIEPRSSGPLANTLPTGPIIY